MALQKNRKDVNAVVHTHSNHATALAIQEMEIPAIHYMVAAGGGPNIRCAPYATFGTEELSQHALKALENRKCCLLAHHGVINGGEPLEGPLACRRCGNPGQTVFADSVLGKRSKATFRG